MPIGWSIRRYLVTLVLAMAVPLFALLVYSLQENYRHALNEAEGTAKRFSELVAADSRRFVHDSQEFLEGLAARPLVRLLDASNCDPILAEFKAFFPKFANLAIADASGEIVCSALPKKGDRRQSIAGTEWFADIRRNNRFVAGKAHVGPVSGKWVAVLAQPVHDESGAFAGLVGFALDLLRYPAVPGNVQLPIGLVVHIVDGAGKVVSRSVDPEAWVGKAFPDAEALLRARASEASGAAILGHGDDERLIAYAPIAGTDWQVISVQPAELVLRQLWLRANQKYFGALLLIALGGLLAFHVGRRILRPMANIMRTASHIADGEFGHRARPNEGPAEIAAFAQNFNHMLDVRLKAEEKYRDLLESASDAIVVVNAAGHIVLVNARAEQYFAYPRDEMLGQPIEMLVVENLREKHRLQVENYTAEALPRHVGRLVEGLRKDGSTFPCEVTLSPLHTADGVVVSAFIHDLTERTQYQEQLNYLSQYDTLTGLPNRHLLRDRLQQAMSRANGLGGQLAVIYLDLDGFKEINDFHGHAFADRLLRAISERVRAALREVDTLARLGSDEFCAVIESTGQDARIQDVAENIRASLNVPLPLDGREIHPSVSMGVAVYPSDGADLDSLLKSADLALTQAKRDGGNGFCFFAAEMDARAGERQALLGRLRRAQERGELLLHYQPQVETGSGRLVGVEALLRWQSPELGMVGPARFIPLAEETGLIEGIGEWVLQTACRQGVAWQRQGLPPMLIAVNLSARQFRQKNLALLVRQALRDSGLEAHWLELEVTEGMLMHDPEQAAAILRELSGMGVHIAVDDFGTGYSSLSYLKRFPVTRLKVDQSFVRDIPGDQDDAAIVTAVVSLAHSLRMGVIAEGVEAEAQRAFLLGLNCELCQGYLFSRPLPADEIPAFLFRQEKLFAPQQ